MSGRTGRLSVSEGLGVGAALLVVFGGMIVNGSANDACTLGLAAALALLLAGLLTAPWSGPPWRRRGGWSPPPPSSPS